MLCPYRTERKDYQDKFMECIKNECAAYLYKRENGKAATYIRCGRLNNAEGATNFWRLVN